MRLAGVPYKTIADKLGYGSQAAASTDVTRALTMAARAQQESSEQLLQIEIDRLDRMVAALCTSACGGDVKAVEAVERLIVRRCTLLGLDLINRNGAENSDVVSFLGNRSRPSRLAGSTGPIIDALVRFTGPAVNPALTDVATAGTVSRPSGLLAGERLLIDCGQMRARLVTIDTWDMTAGTDVTGADRRDRPRVGVPLAPPDTRCGRARPLLPGRARHHHGGLQDRRSRPPLIPVDLQRRDP
jgi:hypothetical protein